MQHGLLELDSYLPPQIEDEEDMATDKQILDLHNRVAKIEGSLVTIKVMVGLLSLLVVPALLGAIAFGGSIAQRVSHLEGEKGDPLGATVKGIESPGSRQQLDANLALLTGQILVDRAEGRKPKEQNIIKISSAVKVASENNPDDPEVWRTATRLVGYRFGTTSTLPPAMPNCLDQTMPHIGTLYKNAQGAFVETPSGDYPDAVFTGEVFQVSNCAIDLDDNGDFSLSALGAKIAEDKAKSPNLKSFILLITNARITYSGGRLLPFNSIQWASCVFDPRPSDGIPSRQSKSITTQLLAADPTGGVIQLPAGL